MSSIRPKSQAGRCAKHSFNQNSQLNVQAKTVELEVEVAVEVQVEAEAEAEAQAKADVDARAETKAEAEVEVELEVEVEVISLVQIRVLENKLRNLIISINIKFLSQFYMLDSINESFLNDYEHGMMNFQNRGRHRNRGRRHIKSPESIFQKLDRKSISIH